MNPAHIYAICPTTGNRRFETSTGSISPWLRNGKELLLWLADHNWTPAYEAFDPCI